MALGDTEAGEPRVFEEVSSEEEEEEGDEVEVEEEEDELMYVYIHMGHVACPVGQPYRARGGVHG